MTNKINNKSKKFINNVLDDTFEKLKITTQNVPNSKQLNINKLNDNSANLKINSSNDILNDILNSINFKNQNSVEKFKSKFIKNILFENIVIVENQPMNISVNFIYDYLMLYFCYEKYPDIYKILCSKLRELNMKDYDFIKKSNQTKLIKNFTKWFNEKFNFFVNNFSTLSKYDQKIIKIAQQKDDYTKILDKKVQQILGAKKTLFSFSQKKSVINDNLQKIKFNYYSYANYNLNDLNDDIKKNVLKIFKKYNITSNSFNLNSLNINDKDKIYLFNILPSKTPTKIPKTMFLRLFYYYYTYSLLINLVEIYSNKNIMENSKLYNFLNEMINIQKDILKCSTLKLKYLSSNYIKSKYATNNNIYDNYLFKTWYFNYLTTSYQNNLENIFNNINDIEYQIILRNSNTGKNNIVSIYGIDIILKDYYLIFTYQINNNDLNIYYYNRYKKNYSNNDLSNTNLLVSLNITNNEVSYTNNNNLKVNQRKNKVNNNTTNKSITNKSTNSNNKLKPRIKIGGQTNNNIYYSIKKTKIGLLKNTIYIFTINNRDLYYVKKDNNKFVFIRKCDNTAMGLLIPNGNNYRLSIRGKLIKNSAEIFIFYLLSTCILTNIPKNYSELNYKLNLNKLETFKIGNDGECILY